MDKTSDAFALWQQMVGEMQKGFSAFAKQAMTTPGQQASDPRGFSANSAQKQLADLVENYCVGMNLPSRAQLDVITDRLQAIETELSEVKSLLRQQQIAAKSDTRPPPPRVRRPPNPAVSKAANIEKAPPSGDM